MKAMKMSISAEKLVTYLQIVSNLHFLLAPEAAENSSQLTGRNYF